MYFFGGALDGSATSGCVKSPSLPSSTSWGVTRDCRKLSQLGEAILLVLAIVGDGLVKLAEELDAFFG